MTTLLENHSTGRKILILIAIGFFFTFLMVVLKNTGHQQSHSLAQISAPESLVDQPDQHMMKEVTQAVPAQEEQGTSLGEDPSAPILPGENDMIDMEAQTQQAASETALAMEENSSKQNPQVADSEPANAGKLEVTAEDLNLSSSELVMKAKNFSAQIDKMENKISDIKTDIASAQAEMATQLQENPIENLSPQLPKTADASSMMTFAPTEKSAAKDSAASADSPAAIVDSRRVQVFPSAYSPEAILSTCQMQDWGVEFKCDLNWEGVNSAHPERAPILLSKTPLVTLNWEKFDRNVRFLGQLNKFFFEKTGLYEPGFVMENVRFAGYNAIAVKGFDQRLADTERRDYFYIYDNQLISVSFRLFPKDQWDKGKFLVQEVKNSFAPIR